MDPPGSRRWVRSTRRAVGRSGLCAAHVGRQRDGLVRALRASSPRPDGERGQQGLGASDDGDLRSAERPTAHGVPALPLLDLGCGSRGRARGPIEERAPWSGVDRHRHGNGGPESGRPRSCRREEGRQRGPHVRFVGRIAARAKGRGTEGGCRRDGRAVAGRRGCSRYRVRHRLGGVRGRGDRDGARGTFPDGQLDVGCEYLRAPAGLVALLRSGPLRRRRSRKRRRRPNCTRPSFVQLEVVRCMAAMAAAARRV